ncbi:unnamed protein product [Cunninghamella blakesleeana]
MDYSNILAPNEPSFWRLCDGYDCHCDFRLTISHCEEANALRIINIVDIAWSGITSVVVFGILYFRVVHRKQQIFDFSGRFPRPKPIESMSVFCMLFNFFRLLHATILVTDTVKNGIFRAFMFEFPWSFGITALACYLFGVVHTLSSSSSTIYLSWVKSQLLVDLFCAAMVILPFITINPLALVAGYYAQIGDTHMALRWTEAIYYLWLFYTFTLGSLVLLAGLRLLTLLRKHLAMQENIKENRDKIRLGATKVKIIIGIACFCLWAFSIMIAIYVSSRYYVMSNFNFTIVLAALAIFNGPLASSIIEFALLININTMNGLSNISFGSTNGNHFGIDNQQVTSVTTNSQNGSTTLGSQGLVGATESFKIEQWSRFTPTPQFISKSESITVQEIEDNRLNLNKKSFDINDHRNNNNNNNNINNNNDYNHNNNTEESFHQKFGYSLSAFATQKDMSSEISQYSTTPMISSSYQLNQQYSNDHDSNYIEMSKLEEDQLCYNALTNHHMRKPPSSSFNHND